MMPPATAQAGTAFRSARVAAAIALMVSLLFGVTPACAGLAFLMVLLVLLQARGGQTFWFPARWELVGVLAAGIIASVGGWGPLPFLAAVGAVVTATDAQASASARFRLLAQPAILGGAIVVAAGVVLMGRSQLFSPQPWMQTASMLLGISAGGAAIVYGSLPAGWRLLWPGGVTGLAVFAATASLSPAGAAMAICGSATACLLCLGLHRRLFARRWVRWMLLIGAWSCMGVVGMRTGTWLRSSGVPAAPGQWSDSGVAGPAMACLLALGTLYSLARHLMRRTCGRVEAAGAFACIVGSVAGCVFADPFRHGALLFAFFLVAAAPAWIRRPVPPAHMMQLCLDYGWVRVSIVGEGMRRLLKVGIAFGSARPSP